MQLKEGANTPYNVQILSSGLCNAQAKVDTVSLRVAWVVEDSKTRPICYGYTDYDRKGSLDKEYVEHSYRLRAELDKKDVAEMLREVSSATRVEAREFRYRLACLMLAEEGGAYGGSFN